MPISSQLPVSLTRKKKLRVIISVVDRTRRKRLNGGRDRRRVNRPYVALKRKNGMSILSTRNAPIRKGSKTVVNRYTLSNEKELTEAMFPVPKKARLTKKENPRATRSSENVMLACCHYKML